MGDGRPDLLAPTSAARPLDSVEPAESADDDRDTRPLVGVPGWLSELVEEAEPCLDTLPGRGALFRTAGLKLAMKSRETCGDC